MGLYRVMVSGEQEYWETLEVEADSKLEAESKALDIAARKHEEEWENSTDVINIQVEGVECLESTPSKSSDLAWVEDITRGSE